VKPVHLRLLPPSRLGGCLVCSDRHSTQHICYCTKQDLGPEKKKKKKKKKHVIYNIIYLLIHILMYHDTNTRAHFSFSSTDGSYIYIYIIFIYNKLYIYMYIVQDRCTYYSILPYSIKYPKRYPQGQEYPPVHQGHSLNHVPQQLPNPSRTHCRDLSFLMFRLLCQDSPRATSSVNLSVCWSFVSLRGNQHRITILLI